MTITLFSSESVTQGHPDKLCDQISDSVLDALLSQDPTSRVACETATTTGTIWVFGEVDTGGYVDIEQLVRETVLQVGYSGHEFGFDGNSCGVLNSISGQSPDIVRGVDRSSETDPYDRIGAGDQGMVFGYACDETEQDFENNHATTSSDGFHGRFMPLPISLAHDLTKKLDTVRKSGTIPWLGPDGKSQVTIAYEDGKPSYIDTVLISAQHLPDVSMGTIREALIEEVIKDTCPGYLLNAATKYLVNPTGRFVTGGPMGDAGLTGRKIIVDTYGGAARHGGGAFSGKDPSKVDRSAAYAARHVAKNIVAAGLASRLEVQISYAIGVAQPVSVLVDSFGTAIRADLDLAKVVEAHFDLRPGAIIERFDLTRPIYQQTASYGHFGRNDLELPWEQIDMAESLREFR